MLELNVIQECHDAKGWQTPFLTVDKPDGSICVCLNFKKTLNVRLKDEEIFTQCPADELFAKIRPGNKYFAALDLVKGYWQLPLRQEDRQKNMFSMGREVVRIYPPPIWVEDSRRDFLPYHLESPVDD